MSAMQAEVFEAFRAIDIPEDKAFPAAAALAGALASEVGAATAPQRDDVSNLKGDVSVLKADVAALKSDMVIVKADVAVLKVDVTTLNIGQERTNGELAVLRWMVGFVLAFLVAIALKIFLR